MSIISIIVPVYKVEKYLERCVQSILAQSFSDYDLVLVDDGSPDKCGDMCDEYARQDSRIHVIHQANGGLSAARNTGIEWVLQHSNSEWITFVDSDDWIHPQYLELMLQHAQDKKLSLVVAECFITDKMVDYPHLSSSSFSIERTEDAFQNPKLDAVAAWGRLYRKELFKEIRFPVGKLHEDRFTTYKLYFQFKTIGVVNAPLYYYFINEEGIVHTKWHPRKMDNLEAAEQQLFFFKNTHNDEMYLYILKDYINICVYFLRVIGKNKSHKAYAKIIRSKLRKTLHDEHKLLKYNIRDQFNIYKYAYPLLMRIYHRLFM